MENGGRCVAYDNGNDFTHSFLRCSESILIVRRASAHHGKMGRCLN